MATLRIASAVMALLFFVCVLLQYNDPDPVQWMAIYGAATIVCGVHAWRGRMPAVWPLVVAGVAILWGVFVALDIHGHFEWHHLAESMHAGTPQIEESRESLGLFIVAAWMLAIGLGGRVAATRRTA